MKLKEWQWVGIFAVVVTTMAFVERRFRILYVAAGLLYIFALIMWVKTEYDEARVKDKNIERSENNGRLSRRKR